METNDIQTIFKYNNEQLLLTNLNYIKSNFIIHNWNKNRPSCKKRVNDIYEYYISLNLSENDLISGIIYVWKKINNNIPTYYIYDGLHRYSACLKLDINVKILLHINDSLNEEDIKNNFINLNKSVPVPSIYIDNELLYKKNICEHVADKLCNSYPKFLSSSRKPHSCNFNRDLFIEFISELNINFQIKNIDLIIFKILLKLNDYAKNKIIESNITHPLKCKKYNFYLFYLEKHYIKEQLELAILNNFN